MNTIVMNTLTGAVSEYDGFAFQSITPAHAASVMGLFALGGEDDAGNPIVSTITTGKAQQGSSLKKMLAAVYFAMKGTGASTLTVHGEQASYAYPFTGSPAGVARVRTGRGIRENYLAFAYSNTDGATFQLDKMEVLVAESKNRRI